MNRFKRVALVLGASLMSISAFGQLTSSYFMPGSTFRGELNPAFRPLRGYVSLPAVGGTNAKFISNSLTVDNLFYPHEGELVSFLHSSVDAEQFLSTLNKGDNTLNAGVNIKILGIGTYVGRGFVTLDVDVKTDVQANLPYELFDLLKNSKAGQTYSLAGTKLNATATAEAALGYSRELFKGFTLGLRGKFIAGLGYAQMNFDQFDLAMNEDAWVINSRGVANVAMNGLHIPTGDNGAWDFEGIEFAMPEQMSGSGMAIDLGATYDLGFATLSASVLNLGFMKWSAENIQSGVASGSYTYTGAEIGSGATTNPMEGVEFADFVQFKPTASEDLSTKLTSNVVLGAEVPLISDIFSVGVVYNLAMRELYNTSELTLAATLTPTRWLSASATYSSFGAEMRGAETFGLALNFHPSWINLFVGTDYMIKEVTPQFIPVSQNKLNLYFGVSVPLARSKY